jgi:hypothetical protein
MSNQRMLQQTARSQEEEEEEEEEKAKRPSALISFSVPIFMSI